ncbi:MAG: hypothetical protein ACHQEM_01020 [Chitinophagales bacterium]
MSQSLLEKLQLKDEKSLLIQGLPSSIEKQFAKLAFSKNVTPWLKNKKIDFALVFAVNEVQLKAIINEVLPALHVKGKLWVAIPKTSSKIATTLNRDCSWSCLTHSGFEETEQVTLDHVWTALHFRKSAVSNVSKKAISRRSEEVVAVLEEEMEAVAGQISREIKRGKLETQFLGKLATTNKQEFAAWIKDPKKTGAKNSRLNQVVGK